MHYLRPLYAGLLGWALMLSTSSFSHLSMVNGTGQLVLFLFVVCLPIWRTGRMSYVDIGWPFGLVLLGIISFFLSEGYWLRSLLVSGIVVLVGLRMGLGALNMWRMGLLKKEFPRYQYQRIRWAGEGKDNTALALQVDAISQGLANASFLALPIFIMASNTSQEFFAIRVPGSSHMGFSLCDGVHCRYSEASISSRNEGGREAGARCAASACGNTAVTLTILLNGWCGMGWLLAAIPSWLSLRGFESDVVWLLLGLGLLFTSRAMYVTLVHTTGAVPSEYFSAQKRPDYVSYQKQTNRFFPGPSKPL